MKWNACFLEKTKGGKVDLPASGKDIFTPGEMLIVLRVSVTLYTTMCVLRQLGSVGVSW